jgi:hypothetical protein
MRIERLSIENFGPFRGLHEVDLEDTIYAVTARREDDPERSNWQGKSSFLESIVFALYGTHRHALEDDVITTGEHVVQVQLILSDGTRILRTRRKGKATRLTVHQEGQGEAVQAEAQAAIERLTGLSETDFRATCYIEQKKMSHFVMADPRERMAVLTSWLKLAPLQEAEANLRDLVKQSTDLVNKHHSDRQAWVSQVNRLADVLFPDATSNTVEPRAMYAEIGTRVEDAKKVRDGLVGRVSRLELERDRAAGQERDLEDARQWALVCEEGKALGASLAGQDALTYQARVEAARQSYNDVTADVRRSHGELTQKAALATGAFDGTCPVANIPCPAKEVLQSRTVENQGLLDTAQVVYQTGLALQKRAKETLEDEERKLQEFNRLKAKLENLKEQARRLAPARHRVEKGGVPANLDRAVQAAELAGARSELADVEVKLRTWSAMKPELDNYLAQCERLLLLIEEVNRKLDTLREALMVVGRNGAQRRIAETALTDIESRANALLQESGIDLSLEVKWAREGQGLATHCEACGSTFPTSAKVKSCSKCATPRGPKVVNKLELILSDRSGAAEDLAGGAFQLAASAWLREDRLSAWSTMIVDEPFGSLDATNRRAFATHLAVMLRSRYGFTQAFVVSHHTNVNDALPARIVIVGSESGSRIELE